jgi:hypothetical protein
MNRGHKAIVQVILLQGTYTFIIHLPYDKTLYIYNPYFALPTREGIQQRGQRPGFIPPPVEQSASYVYEVVNHLSLYREVITVYALNHMDAYLLTPHKSEYKEMVPSLFYRNLKSEACRGDIIVRRPGSGGGGGPIINSIKRTGKCIIEPVYGPCHNPLKITTIDGRLITVYLGINMESGVIEEGGERADSMVVKTGIHSKFNYSYDILAIVSGLATLDKLDYEAVGRFLSTYEPNLDLLGMFHSARLSVIQPDVLQAIKLSQVYKPRANNEIQLSLAKEWHSKIYGEYSLFHGSKNVSEIRSDTTNTLKNIISDLKTVL